MESKKGFFVAQVGLVSSCDAAFRNDEHMPATQKQNRHQKPKVFESRNILWYEWITASRPKNVFQLPYVTNDCCRLKCQINFWPFHHLPEATLFAQGLMELATSYFSLVLHHLWLVFSESRSPTKNTTIIRLSNQTIIHPNVCPFWESQICRRSWMWGKTSFLGTTWTLLLEVRSRGMVSNLAGMLQQLYR